MRIKDLFGIYHDINTSPSEDASFWQSGGMKKGYLDLNNFNHQSGEKNNFSKYIDTQDKKW